jgi:hypothetical protein
MREIDSLGRGESFVIRVIIDCDRSPEEDCLFEETKERGGKERKGEERRKEKVGKDPSASIINS